MRAESLAIRLAEVLHRLAEDDVVAQGNAQRNAISFIEREIDFSLFQLHFDVVFDFRLWPEKQIQYRVDMLRGRLQAAVANAIEVDLDRAPYADFAESVLEQLGLAGGPEQAALVQILSEIDLSRRVGQIKMDGMVFEFGNGKEHRRALVFQARKSANLHNTWSGRTGMSGIAGRVGVSVMLAQRSCA